MTAPVLPRQCVVDASVLIKYIVPEAETRRVRQLVGELLDGDKASIQVPDLLFVECANALWKKVRRGEVDLSAARLNLQILVDLDLDTTPVLDLAAPALQLACAHGITAYDACYVALAQHLGIPLLTADDRLLSQLQGTAHVLLSLQASISPQLSPPTP